MHAKLAAALRAAGVNVGAPYNNLLDVCPPGVDTGKAWAASGPYVNMGNVDGSWGLDFYPNGGQGGQIVPGMPGVLTYDGPCARANVKTVMAWALPILRAHGLAPAAG